MMTTLQLRIETCEQCAGDCGVGRCLLCGEYRYLTDWEVWDHDCPTCHRVHHGTAMIGICPACEQAVVGGYEPVGKVCRREAEAAAAKEVGKRNRKPRTKARA